MQRFFKFGFLFLLLASVAFTSCSASKKCGCPNKRGMVGY